MNKEISVSPRHREKSLEDIESKTKKTENKDLDDSNNDLSIIEYLKLIRQEYPDPGRN